MFFWSIGGWKIKKSTGLDFTSARDELQDLGPAIQLLCGFIFMVRLWGQLMSTLTFYSFMKTRGQAVGPSSPYLLSGTLAKDSRIARRQQGRKILEKNAGCSRIFHPEPPQSSGENRRFPKGLETSTHWFCWGARVDDSFAISKWHWENTAWVLSGQESSWGCDPVVRSVVFAFGTLEPLLLPFLPGRFSHASPVWSLY